jgi:hypothetical protein
MTYTWHALKNRMTRNASRTSGPKVKSSGGAGDYSADQNKAADRLTRRVNLAELCAGAAYGHG